MAISTTTNTVLLAGNSSTVVFPYQFPFYQLTDPKVYLFDTIAGGITPQVLGSNYSVAATANSNGIYPNGGNIIFTSSVINTTIVVIDRQPIETQTFSILQDGFISSVGLTQQLDYLTLLIQDMADRVSRAVSLPTGFGQTNLFNPQLPPFTANGSSAGLYLSINSTATGFAWVGSSTLPTGPSGYVWTGNGIGQPATFNPLSLSGSNVTGTLSLGNGGTGGLVPSEWGVVFASSATQLATTAPGPIGLPLIANASSAPTFQQLPYITAGSGVIPLSLGGTGQTTAPLAAQALSPTTTWGDLIYSGSGNIATRLAAGSSGTVLQSFGAGATPGWGASAPTTPVLIIASSVLPSALFPQVNGDVSIPVGTTTAALIAGSNATLQQLGNGNNLNLNANLLPLSDNTFNIGSSANRFANGYFGTSLVVGSTILNHGSVTLLPAGATGGTVRYGYGAGWSEIAFDGVELIGEDNVGYDTFLFKNANAPLYNFYGGANTPIFSLNGSSLTLQNGVNTLNLSGISIVNQSSLGSYNFNLPISSGSSGFILSSGGGGGNQMSWIAPTSGLQYAQNQYGVVVSGSSSTQLNVIPPVTSNSSCVLIQTGSAGVATTAIWQPVSPPRTTYLSVVSGSSATGTFTPTAGCVALEITVVGPGGAGGGVASSVSTSAAGGGGGAGGGAIKLMSGSSLLSSYSYAVWAGAGPGAAGNNAGQTASSCFFGSLVATGGGGGAGSAALSAAGSTNGGSGGLAFGGDLNITGGGGLPGLTLSILSAVQGGGGTSILSEPTAGGGGSGTGENGTGYGGGGTGGVQSNAGGATVGGSGSPGVIIVKQYFIQ